MDREMKVDESFLEELEPTFFVWLCEAAFFLEEYKYDVVFRGKEGHSFEEVCVWSSERDARSAKKSSETSVTAQSVVIFVSFSATQQDFVQRAAAAASM